MKKICAFCSLDLSRQHPEMALWKYLQSITIYSVLFLSSCSSLDFSLPKRDLVFDTLGDVGNAASISATGYRIRANQLVNEGIFFEGPAMGATVGTAASAIFRGSLHEIQAFGLAALSFVGADQYFAPRDRAKIYLNASSQMSCLATLAYRSFFLLYFVGNDGNLHFKRAFLFAVKLLHNPSLTDAQRAALTIVADLPNTAVLSIATAMDIVDRAALANSLGSSKFDTTKLQNELVSNIQEANVVKAAATEAAAADPSAKPAASATGVAAPNPKTPTADEKAAGAKDLVQPLIAGQQPKDPPVDDASARYLIDFAADFPTKITRCTGAAISTQ